MRLQTILKAILILFVALLCPLYGHSQTLRGDFNMDGRVSLNDVTSMINYMLTDSPGEATTADRDTITVNGVPFVMIRVQGGTYNREVLGTGQTVETYSMSQTEVTVAQWLTVMDTLPRGNGAGPSQLPVVNASWNLCQEFISRLNAVTGQNFRLPTMIEWEYAACGGRLTRGYRYAGSDNLDEVGWYIENHSSNPHVIGDVGKLNPNELGLYDMSGNVAEWCQDIIFYDSDGNPFYCARGGTAFADEKDCRVTTMPLAKYQSDADTPIGLNGFRLAW